MSGKWTPGPWRVDFGEVFRIRDMSKATLATVSCTHLSGRRDIVEVEDNARLIAAAPELAEALEELLAYSGGAENALADEYVVDRARAALAKAKGEGA